MSMIGLLIVAHAPLASALAACAAHVYTCDQECARRQVRVLDVPPDGDPAATLAEARRLIGEVDSGDGALVLTDVAGATPGNIAARLLDPPRIAVLAGVNLPMLLRVLCYRDGDLEQTVAKALGGGAQGILRIADDAPRTTACRAGKENDQARLHHQ
jgi:PTS system ascorbate-specific IIA component